jgi:hypothetical protein
MRTLLICTTAIGLPWALGGCQKEDETTPAAAPVATAAYPASQARPQPTGGRYSASAPATTGQSPAPPAATQSPAPAPAPPPAAPGQMAAPGALASQCQNDLPCGTHRCNVAYGKCAFPCQTNVDCLAPNTCMTGFCVPAPVPQPSK